MTYARACNILQIDPSTESTPEWIQLLPAGSIITGTDGRSWQLEAQHLIDAFQQRNTPLVLDWEHASEHRAPHGLDAPAAGWIDQLEVRDGAIWGHVEWTERAAQQIQAREYRYLSPVFTYEPHSRRIHALISVGLTNQPNLNLTALNREECPMPLPLALCQALNIDPNADESAALTAIQSLKTELVTAKNRAETPALDKFVPRADHDVALARAANAEQQLKTLKDAQQKTQIDALIQQGLSDGKISPATQEYYRAMCQTEKGIEQFTDFLEKAPRLVGDDSGLDGTSPTGTKPITAETLTTEQRAICQSMGIDPAEYAKNLTEQKEAA